MPTSSTQSSQSATRGRMPNARGDNPSTRGERRAATGQQAAEDQVYGIVSVLYHALQGEQAYEKYAKDAGQAGDRELEQFFERCRTEEHARAQQAKSLLAARLDDEDDETAELASDEDEDEKND